jgi:capsular exopolysaccharide synthesis family protein
MTRLSDALDRANTLKDDNARPPASSASLSGDWQFDGADRRLASPSPLRAVEPPPAIVEPPPRAVEAPRALETRFSANDRSKVVVGPEANGGVVEQYRRLAAVLHHAQTDKRARSVMIASAVPGEGKTLTSTNLALTLSESYQRRVLLIDGDLRRPRIHSMFGLPNGAGLVDCLSQPVEGRLPVEDVSPTLCVLTAGRASPDPMGLLVSDAMQQLLREAMATFDWVVVDTPPVGILSDANLLAGMIDTALLVIQARTTPYPLVQRAIDAIGRPKILGVVLNRAEGPELSHGYGYGYYADGEGWGRGSPPAPWRQGLDKRAS